jgi:hypothetical protein
VTNDSPSHVVDVNGFVWAVVRDGGMATRAHYAGITSCGIAWLESEAGPLLPFDPIAYRRELWAAEVRRAERRAAALGLDVRSTL